MRPVDVTMHDKEQLSIVDAPLRAAAGEFSFLSGGGALSQIANSLNQILSALGL